MEDVVTRLKRLDCCAVSDALDKLAIKGRVVSGLRAESIPARIAGKAVTYRLVAFDEEKTQDGPPKHLGTTAIELADPGDVIVVEQRTGIDAGSWGGILSLAAKLRGIAGVVADGPVRDIDEARTYKFPIYCGSLTAKTARGRVVEAEVNGAVTIGGLVVNAGDYVLADSSGVAFIPSSEIGRVLSSAEMIADREAAMAKALLDGANVTDVMGANYEHMLR